VPLLAPKARTAAQHRPAASPEIEYENFTGKSLLYLDWLNAITFIGAILKLVSPQNTAITAIQGILHQRCPRCRKGPIFRASLWRGFLSMYDQCPECGLKFDREPGYFLGAMYFSYLLSILPSLAVVLLIWRLSGWPFDTVMICAFVGYLPFVPAVTRWARVLWIYVDRHFDP